jgi:hypothetical protein
MHQNLKCLSQIEGTYFKFKNQKQFLFKSRYTVSIQDKKTLKSHVTVPLKGYRSSEYGGFLITRVNCAWEEAWWRHENHASRLTEDGLGECISVYLYKSLKIWADTCLKTNALHLTWILEFTSRDEKHMNEVAAKYVETICQVGDSTIFPWVYTSKSSKNQNNGCTDLHMYMKNIVQLINMWKFYFEDVQF